MEQATKTTLYLADSLRTRLKMLATHRKKTVTDLLAEGAEMVLARYEGSRDRERLRRMAREARASMRKGLFSAPGVSADEADAVVYGVRSHRKTR